MSLLRLSLSLIIISLSTGMSAQEKIELYTPKKFYEKAHELFSEAEYTEADKYFSKIHMNDSLYGEALINRVLCKRYSGQFESGLELAEKGLALNEDYIPKFYINKAVLLDSLDRSDEAMSVLLDAEKELPWNYNLKLARSEFLLASGKHQEAIDLIEKCIQDEPERYLGHLYLAQVYAQTDGLSHTLLPLAAALALTPEREGNASLIIFADELVSSNSKSEDPIFDVDYKLDRFEETDDLMRNYVALSDDYKIPGPYQFGLIKQLHLLLSEMDGSGSGFISKTYVPIFKSFSGDDFKYFAGLICAISTNESHQKFLNKKIDKIKEVSYKINNHFNELAHNKTAPEGLTKNKVSYFHNEEDRLSLICEYDQEADILLGPAWRFNSKGTLSAKEYYDAQGRATDSWTWYHDNGTIRRESTFVDDELTGKCVYYTKDGNLRSVVHFDKDKVNGLVQRYKIIGYKYEETQYEDGVEHGLLTGYFPDQSIRYKFPIEKGERHGDCTSYYEDGSVRVTNHYINGKINGIEKSYYRNGQLEYEVTYLDHELNGPYKTYYKNGQQKSVGEYKSGNQVGKWTEWNLQGKITQKDEFDEKGKENGIVRIFDHKGRPLTDYKYKNGNLIEVMTYDNTGAVREKFKSKKGKIKFKTYNFVGTPYAEAEYTDGKRSGAWTYYDDYGNKSSTLFYSDGLLNTDYIYYHTNGKVSSITRYVDGKKEGLQEAYYFNGQLKRQGSFINDQLSGRYIEYNIEGNIEEDEFYVQGVLHGVNKYCNPDGTVYKEKTYELGYPIQGTHFSPNGEITGHFELKNGDGIEQYTYGPGGPVMGRINYKGGSLNGNYELFHLDGQPRFTGNYINDNAHGTFTRYLPGGKVSSIRKYEYGNASGDCTIFDLDGSKKYEFHYDNNNLNGSYKVFHPNGQLREEYNYDHGIIQGDDKVYNEQNELIINYQYDHDIIVGYNYMNADNKLVESIPLPQGTGKIKAFYPNGNTSIICNMVRGEFDGSHEEYYSNGQLRRKNNFDLNSLDKTQYSYYKDGTLRSERNYTIGHKIGVHKFYHPNGKLKRLENWFADEQDGSTFIYDEEGNQIAEHIYKGNVIYEIK